MKKLVGAVAVVLSAEAVFAAKYDVDFQKASDGFYGNLPFQGENLLMVPSLPVRLEVGKDNGRKFENKVSWRAKIPTTPGLDFDFSLAYRLHHDDSVLSRNAYVHVFDAKTRQKIQGGFVLIDSAWDNPIFFRRITIPKYVDEIEVVVGLTGSGWLEISRAHCSVAPIPEKPVEITLNPQGWLDQTVFIGEGQPAEINYFWHTRILRFYPQDKLVFEIELPRGYEFVEPAFGQSDKVTSSPMPGGGTFITFPCEPIGATPKRYYGPTPNNKFNSDQSILLRATGKSGDSGQMRLRMVWNGEDVSGWNVATLRTVPPVKAVKPRRYKNGVLLDCDSLAFKTPAAIEMIAKYVVEDCGVDWLIDQWGGFDGSDKKMDKAMASAWRKHGLAVRTPFWSKLCNGHVIGPWEGRPDSDKFVSAEAYGVKRWYNPKIARGVCPAAIYEERPFFMTNTVPAFVETYRGTDGAWVNWEPWAFRDVGCFCTNCLHKFAAHLGKSITEVSADWPRCAMEGGRWRKEALDFRAMEHAKMVRTIDKYIRRVTGGEQSLGFISGVSWNEMTYAWRDVDVVLPEFRPYFYASDMRWINPWGPYTHWRCRQPYVYFKRDVLRNFFNAKDVREQTNADYSETKCPKLLAMPNGSQGEWIVTPSWFEMSLDSYFFNGWHAAVPFVFPGCGYDARWWQAFADATTRAAKYEDFVFDGRRCDSDAELIPIKEYALNSPGVTHRLPKYRDVSLLQHALYEKGGARIVAVFNFWDWGEAFFTLRIRKLPMGQYVVKDEDGAIWTTDSGCMYTSGALEAGIDVYVPKASTRVFEILPAGEAGTILSQIKAGEVKRLCEERRPALAALAAKDAAYEKANADDKPVTVGIKATMAVQE